MTEIITQLRVGMAQISPVWFGRQKAIGFDLISNDSIGIVLTNLHGILRKLKNSLPRIITIKWFCQS